MQHRQLGGLALAIILISACASAPGDPARPTPSAQPTMTAALRASPTGVVRIDQAVGGDAEATPLPGDSALGSFTTAEGLYGIGRSDAPNLIVMYSDVF